MVNRSMKGLENHQLIKLKLEDECKRGLDHDVFTPTRD